MSGLHIRISHGVPIPIKRESANVRTTERKVNIFQTNCEPTPRERSKLFVVCRHSSPGLFRIFVFAFTSAGSVHVCLCVQAVPTFLPRVVPDGFAWFHILLVVCNVCITSWRLQVGHGNQSTSTYGSVVTIIFIIVIVIFTTVEMH